MGDGGMDSPGSSNVIVMNTDFKSRLFPQILATMIATLGSFQAGLMLGFSSPGIPSLEKRGDFGEITAQEKSWIGSIANIGAFLAAFVAGYCIDKFGRKATLLGITVPSLIGWILLACSQNVLMMLGARVITGFAAGAFTLVVPVYIAEISEQRIRGTLGSCSTLILVIGILFMYIVGAFISWIWLAIICTIFPVLMFLCLLVVPESPRYLIKKGELILASRALMWFRGTKYSEDVEYELRLVEKSIEDDQNQQVKLIDLLSPSILRPLLISMSLMLFQQLGGINAVIFYSVDIFKAAGSDIDPNWSSIIIGTIQVIFVGLSTILVDRAGRKVLVITSNAGMSLSLIVLGVFFYLKHHNNDTVPSGLGWLPLLSLVVYIITYNIAMGSVPWLMMSELLPNRVKGLASALATAFCWLLSFIVTKTFEDLSSLIEPYGCYWLFSGISLLGVGFGIWILPETKGKTLEEIQMLFSAH